MTCRKTFQKSTSNLPIQRCRKEWLALVVTVLVNTFKVGTYRIIMCMNGYQQKEGAFRNT